MDNTPSGNFCLDHIGRLTAFLIASGSSGHARRRRNKKLTPESPLFPLWPGRRRCAPSDRARRSAGPHNFQETRPNIGTLFAAASWGRTTAPGAPYPARCAGPLVHLPSCCGTDRAAQGCQVGPVAPTPLPGPRGRASHPPPQGAVAHMPQPDNSRSRSGRRLAPAKISSASP
jgi:hypothetical protein